MQFRKGLIAAATAAAVMSTGAVAVQAEETTGTSATATTKPAETTEPTTTAKPTTTPTKKPAAPSKPTTTPTKKPTAPSKPTVKDNNSNTDQGSSVKDMSPAEIRDWIAVFTAVIGALGTLFAFMDKYMRP